MHALHVVRAVLGFSEWASKIGGGAGGGCNSEQGITARQYGTSAMGVTRILRSRRQNMLI